MSKNENRVLTELEKNTLMNIGKNVKYTRRDLLNVTLATLSKNTGVSRDVICRLEALSQGVKPETTYPSITTMIKFCEGVGVLPSELFDSEFEQEAEIQNKILEHCKNFRSEDKDIVSLDND